MLEIQRTRGAYQGRNAGTKYNGFAWAVATDRSDSADMFSQTEKSLAEIDRVLAELGTNKTRLLNATVYVTDIAQKYEMDRAWCDWIGEDPAHWPQRACVETGLAGDTLVEIVVIAACP